MAKFDDILDEVGYAATATRKAQVVLDEMDDKFELKEANAKFLAALTAAMKTKPLPNKIIVHRQRTGILAFPYPPRNGLITRRFTISLCDS